MMNWLKRHPVDYSLHHGASYLSDPMGHHAFLEAALMGSMFCHRETYLGSYQHVYSFGHFNINELMWHKSKPLKQPVCMHDWHCSLTWAVKQGCGWRGSAPHPGHGTVGWRRETDPHKICRMIHRRKGGALWLYIMPKSPWSWPPFLLSISLSFSQIGRASCRERV